MEKTETEAKKNRRRPAAKKQTGKKKSSSADKIDSISVRKHTITCTDLEYMMNPLGVLRRGYSMTTDQAGRIIKSVESVQQNDEIKVILPDGAIKAVVQEISVEEVR